MKRKISLLISAICALSACASFTACMTDSQNGKDENIEKAKSNTQIVEQQQENDGSECPDGNCPEEKPAAPDMGDMPIMPEFRFEPRPEHMPAPAIGGKNSGDPEGEHNEPAENVDNENNGEAPEDGKRPPMPAPHRRGKIKPKMPKKGN